MRLNILNELKLESFRVFASLPDMGKVGGLVSSYLAQNLKTQKVADIISREKPWVSYSDGIVRTVIETYQIYYSESYELLIFTGDSQPQEPSELYQLCNSLLDYAQNVGQINRLYSAGGYLREQLTGSPQVCGVVSKPELKKVLDEAGIQVIGNEINSITWFNGLILGLAADRTIDALGLFGEIADTTIPQPLAAKSIIKAFASIENISLHTKKLDRQYEAILEEIQKQKSSSNFP
jgi:uncharacterized protein